ncbi:PhyR family response regulator anti-anti-sigma factor [Hyphomonas sp.]|uniref:PhyR family response regulator anti-anti-sigma factor n=1 Tax=Hyphomonas sp. TaxID=87 RepID=UPI003526F299
MLADLISGDLPYLRRYARALLGTRSAGDLAVETMIETRVLALLNRGQTPSSRLELFRALDETIMEQLGEGTLNQQVLRIMEQMTTDERRAVLLTAVEGFSVFETADILSVSTRFVEDALLSAESSLKSALATSVLIIEDEFVIASELRVLVEEAGHRVLGLAPTRDAAVRLARTGKPGLILSDEVLADGSSGSDAVEEILAIHGSDIPVIFVTAFAERLLQGGAKEPAYLITKPFQPRQVRAVVEQAVISSLMQTAPSAALAS